MSALGEMDLNSLGAHLARLRGNPEHPPDASIIIPVNAKGDLQTVLTPLGDIIRYTGKRTLEVILVINNYPADAPPEAIGQFRQLGLQVVAVPSARRPGEVVIISARALGVRAARSPITIHFDADCHVPNINALLDWYIESLSTTAQLAYSYVGFYHVRNRLSIQVKIAIHHALRWLKRSILGIPTTRGGNYVIQRSLFLQLYEAGKLSVDLQVGPAAKLAGARIVYSSRPSLKVLTSGRKFQGGWIRLFQMLRYRLHYNLHAIPTRRREVTQTSWKGFDQESDRRAVSVVLEEQPALGAEQKTLDSRKEG